MDSFNKIEKLSIKNWSEEDQPREKLMAKGRQVLSDAELLAVLATLEENDSEKCLCRVCKLKRHP